ncbi:MAG: D-alanyl-D-alanine carboxypeptidase family protein [Alphaproteobacteria bacterium]
MRSAFRALPVVLAVGCAFAAGPAAAAYSSIVVDAATGQVVHAIDADHVNYPASLTKIMTLYLTFEAVENHTLILKQPLQVSARAANQAPSKLGLSPGDVITVENAVLGVVTKSANDAAVVLAEAVAGSEADFARAMTAKAKALGMTSTEFHNASGLPNKHQVTTARDMAILARAVLRDFPQYYHYFGTPEFSYQGLTFENHNKLLKSYPGADGIKTGYIRAAGFNLVASAERDGRRLIGVVLGGHSPRQRNAVMASLLDAGFLRGAVREAALAPKPVVAAAENAPVLEAQGDADETENQAPPPRAKHAPSLNGWGIQVGAFSRYAPAHLAATRAARNAPSLLNRTKLSIETIDDGDGKVYRARLMGLTEQRARKACETLAVRKIDCVAVADADSVSVAETGQSGSRAR